MLFVKVCKTSDFELFSYCFEELSYLKMLRADTLAHAAFDAVSRLAAAVLYDEFVCAPWVVLSEQYLAVIAGE